MDDLIDFTGFLPSFTAFYEVLPGFTGFLPSSTTFSLSRIKLTSVILGFTGFDYFLPVLLFFL